METKKLLVIDDRVDYLDAARVAYESCGSTFGYETATFCDSFEKGIEEVRSGRYTHVLTDLFEGEETPKGLLVLMAAKEKGVVAKIVTDGTRHYGKLGSIRYGLMLRDEDYCCSPEHRMLAIEGKTILVRMGLTVEEVVTKIGTRDLDECTVGMSKKDTEEDWYRIYSTFEYELRRDAIVMNQDCYEPD